MKTLTLILLSLTLIACGSNVRTTLGQPLTEWRTANPDFVEHQSHTNNDGTVTHFMKNYTFWSVTLASNKRDLEIVTRDGVIVSSFDR